MLRGLGLPEVARLLHLDRGAILATLHSLNGSPGLPLIPATLPSSGRPAASFGHFTSSFKVLLFIFCTAAKSETLKFKDNGAAMYAILSTPLCLLRKSVNPQEALHDLLLLSPPELITLAQIHGTTGSQASPLPAVLLLRSRHTQ